MTTTIDPAQTPSPLRRASTTLRQGGLLSFAVGVTLVVIPVPIAWLVWSLNGPPTLRNILFGLHVGLAIPPILVGPFLFSAKLRNRFRSGHMRMGKLYIAGCMFSGLTIFPVAITRTDHIIPRVGFTTMSVVWMLTTFFAWRTAVNRNFVDHRRWAMRTYACTVAFIHVNLTFRLVYPYLGPILQKFFQSVLSWNINLILVEVWLAATTYTGKRVGLEQFRTNLKRVYRNAPPRGRVAEIKDMGPQEPVSVG